LIVFFNKHICFSLICSYNKIICLNVLTHDADKNLLKKLNYNYINVEIMIQFCDWISKSNELHNTWIRELSSCWRENHSSFMASSDSLPCACEQLSRCKIQFPITCIRISIFYRTKGISNYICGSKEYSKFIKIWYIGALN